MEDVEPPGCKRWLLSAVSYCKILRKVLPIERDWRRCALLMIHLDSEVLCQVIASNAAGDPDRIDEGDPEALQQRPKEPAL